MVHSVEIVSWWEDNFDGSTPMGRFAIGILTLIAELELERITESWATANKEAVERGVHVSATPPAGYAADRSPPKRSSAASLAARAADTR